MPRNPNREQPVGILFGRESNNRLIYIGAIGSVADLHMTKLILEF
jgi:hypothetical protein